MYDYICSDHKPLYVKIERVIDSADKYTVPGSLSPTRRCWKSVDDMTKFHYSNYVDVLLQNVVVPNDYLGIKGSRDRWRHVTQKGQGHDPNIFIAIISTMVGDTDLVPMEHL